jgi:hypothetical protein
MEYIRRGGPSTSYRPPYYDDQTTGRADEEPALYPTLLRIAFQFFPYFFFGTGILLWRLFGCVGGLSPNHDILEAPNTPALLKYSGRCYRSFFRAVTSYDGLRQPKRTCKRIVVQVLGRTALTLPCIWLVLSWPLLPGYHLMVYHVRSLETVLLFS